MPRFRPVNKVDVIGNLDLSPEKAVGDYIESKQQDAFFKKPPNWDTAGDSVELLFIRSQREHAAMLQLQEEMLENAKKETATNDSRIRELYATHDELRKRFIEVNSFVKDCIDKKRDAEKKIAEETALQEKIKQDILKYKSNIAELVEFRDVLRATVKEFEPYEKVLHEVVTKSGVFTSVKDCMDRCDALMLAQAEISRLEQQKLQEIEEMRARMVKITNEAALVALGLKNDLAELERSYNQARAECAKWEKVLVNAKDTVATYDLDKERSLDGVYNMYRLLCKRRNLDPVFQRHEVEEQLDFIKDEFEILHEVNEQCKKIMKEEETKAHKNGKKK